MRRAVAAAVALAALGATPASAAPVELQGTTTISTSSAGSALVHIGGPTPTFPDMNGKGAIDFQFSGSSFFRAIVLLGETTVADGKRFAGYIDGSLLEGGDAEWSATTIPAGDYRLYALTDGRPTTIAITMPAAGAASGLALPDAFPFDFRAMQSGGGGVFRASAATSGPGTIFADADATFAAGQAGTVEFCDAVGESADSDAAYAFGCSNGSLNTVVGGGEFGEVAASTRFDTPAAARHGFGGNAQSLAPPTIRGAVAAVTFLPSGTPIVGTSPIAAVGGVAARVVGTSIRVTKTGRAPVRVRCAGPGACRVRLSLIGSASRGKATIAQGKTKTVKMRLASAVRKRLKRARSVKATLVLEVTGQSVQGTVVTRTRITLKAPKR
jgi:hypothetical protein